MKYIQIIFSPTGGTQKAANAFTEKWSGVETIDLSVPHKNYAEYTLTSDDVVLIAMPSFGGLAPQVALDRLGKINGNSAKCILMVVYGNREYEDTLVQMEDTAERCGFHIIAAVSAIAEHSIIHQYAKGRPDSNDCRQLSEFADKINDKLCKGDITKPAIPGNRPYKKAGTGGIVPKANSGCTRCGLCAEKCPVQAINIKSPERSDKKKCIYCMRCVSICPQGARGVNELMVSAAALAIKKACSEPKQNKLFI